MYFLQTFYMHCNFDSNSCDFITAKGQKLGERLLTNHQILLIHNRIHIGF